MYGNRRRRHRPLTARQQAVLTLVQEGYRNADIAWILEIKPSGVCGHIAVLQRKLGHKTREALRLSGCPQNEERPHDYGSTD
jgi:DNA-binding CsgD family transcriptional regulator